jgi:cardiolipin synthase
VTARNAARWLTSLVLVGLTLGACARVTPHRSLPAVPLDNPAFFPTFEAWTDSSITGGNAVRLLFNGEQIFPALVQAIASAKTTITYAQYSYADGPVARDIAEALAERCRAGVGVNVLLDMAGSINIPQAYVDTMREAGCHVVFFRPIARWQLWRANNRNHRRILVVDGRVGFTGGAGVSRKWMGNGRVKDHWRDTDVRVEGPVVAQLQAAFVENWLEATGMVLGGSAYFPHPIPRRGELYAQVIRSSPANGELAMYTAFLLALTSARKSITITNPYFVLDEPLTTALTAAKARGVTVRILLPGAIDHAIVRQASRAQFGPLLRAGIELYEYRAALLHAKTMVVDGVWATVGSTNLINRSFAMDDELNLVIYDAGIGSQLEQAFTEDLRHAKRVDAEKWARRGIDQRLLEVLSYPLRLLGAL